MILKLSAVVVLLLAAGAVARRAMQHRVARRRKLTGSARVDELSQWQIGGIRQWVQIRGEDAMNPVLLYLHGGPGLPMIPFVHGIQRSWEEWFTVVHWDQRNAGKTLTTNGVQTDDLSLDLYVNDGLNLVDQLHNRFPGRPIVLFGHSWGTAVAIQMLRRAPSSFAVYLAVGQVSDFLIAERHSYMALVTEANRRGAKRTSRALAAFPDYPAGGALSARSVRTVRTAAMKFGFAHHHNPKAMLELSRLALRSPDYSWRDLIGLSNRKAQSACLDLALRELPAFNAGAAGATIACPIVMIGGRFDLFTPTAMARTFFESLNAPSKEFIEVDDMAHFGPLEEPALFDRILRARILPLLAKWRPETSDQPDNISTQLRSEE